MTRFFIHVLSDHELQNPEVKETESNKYDDDRNITALGSTQQTG